MNKLPIFRDLYRPLQPAIGNRPGAIIRYKEITPSEALKPYVYCYWVLWSKTMLHSPFAYRIASDGCVDLLINCKTFERLIIAGTFNTSTVVSFTGEVEYFGIRFLPGCFHYFFTLPLNDIANKIIPWQEVGGDGLHEFESRLFSARSAKEKIALVESFLWRRFVASNQSPDTRILETLLKIYRQNGHIPVERDLSAGVSPRQLRRLFERHIGVNPKTFSRIVRFQSVLRAMLREPKNEWGKLCFDFGYYDQSHLIHEFQDFYGLPPMSVSFPQE